MRILTIPPKELFDFFSGARYLILPRNLWGEIWNSTGLRDKNRRRDIFDCNDFALGKRSGFSSVHF